MYTFRDRLRYARERFNLSQAGLAESIGVSRGVIFNLENKEWTKQPVVIDAICNRLNVSKEWLLTGHGPMEPENERSKILDELYRVCATLSGPQQEYLLDQIRVMQKHNVLQQEAPDRRPFESSSLADKIQDADSRRTAKPPGLGRNEPDREL